MICIFLGFFLDLHSMLNSTTTDANCSADDPDFILQSNELSELSALAAKNVTITKQNESNISNNFHQNSFCAVNACNDEEMHVKPSEVKGANKKHLFVL